MLPPFDVFKREPDGEVLWIRSAEDFKSARTAVRELMAASPREYIIYSHRTNNQLVIKPHPKPVTKPCIFQIAYDETLMTSRAALLMADGFTVESVLGNEAAKAALEAPAVKYSLFILGGHAAMNVRKEMAAWLKGKYPKVPVLALNPPYQQQLPAADYNVIRNGPEEWLFVVEAST